MRRLLIFIVTVSIPLMGYTRTSPFVHRAYIVIRAGDRITARAIAALDWPGDQSNINSFYVPLSVNGLDPVIAYAASVPMTNRMINQFRTRILTNNEIPLLRFYLLDLKTSVLTQTNSASANSSIGNAWTFDETLTDLNLQRIEPIE